MSGSNFQTPVIGQRALIRGGGTTKGYIGTVVDYEDRFPFCSIHVEHPVTKVVTHYSPGNVELLPLN